MNLKIRNAIHLLVCLFCIIIAASLKRGLGAETTKDLVGYLTAGVGILGAIDIFLKKETKYSTVYFVVDAILVVATIGTSTVGGKLDSVVPFMCIAIMVLYAIYPISYYFGRLAGAFKKHKAGIPICFAILATKFLSVAISLGIYQYFQDVKEGGDPSGSNGYFKLMMTLGIIILVIGVLGYIWTILEKNTGHGPARQRTPSYSPQSSGSNGGGQVDSITYRIASSFSKTYYEGHAIANLRVNRKIRGGDIYFIVSGSCRSAEPITSQTLADLYQRDAARCVRQVQEDIMASAQRALSGVSGQYYIHVESDNISLK